MSDQERRKREWHELNAKDLKRITELEKALAAEREENRIAVQTIANMAVTIAQLREQLAAATELAKQLVAVVKEGK